MMKSNILFFVALLLLSFSSFSLADDAGVTTENPYVRAIPPGQTISAAFMTLKNDTATEIALIKATSDIAENVELHEHVNEDGMMKMRQVPKISVAGKSETALKPGGYHIMLIGLKKAIKPGDMIDIALEFDNGSKQTIKAEVKKIAMGMMKNKAAMGKCGSGKSDSGKCGMGKGGKDGKGKGNKKAQMKAMKHTNPMPNLMRVINKMGDQLNLKDEQAAKLKAWHDERMPIIKQLVADILKKEADLYNAALDNAPLSKIDQLADALMQLRMKLIRNKALCRDNMQRILDNDQYKKVVELYKANFVN